MARASDGEQGQAGATVQGDTSAGEGNVQGEQLFLANENRWENMENGEEKCEDIENESRDV